jgi:GNAT superfamily N-acetyltransferase
VLREDGVRALWFKILGETVYRRLRLVALRPEDATGVESDLALDFRFLEPSDGEDYAQFRPGVSAATVRERLERERCFGAWRDGRLASTRWVTSGSVEIEYLGMRLALADEETWISDTFTDPEHRGRDVSPAAGAALARALAAEGITNQFAGVLPENPLGVRAYEQAGYRRVGTIGYVRLGRRRWDFMRRR